MQTIIITALITAILCTINLRSVGQTFSEWFWQKKTRIKYLKKQVAALEALKTIMEEGYAQAKEGVDSAGAVEETAYQIDEEWLTSLGEVKPVFRENESVKETYAVAKTLISESKEILSSISKSPWLRESELKQLRFDLNLVISDVEQTLKRLLLYITDGKIKMEDGERWKKILGIRDHVKMAAQFEIVQLSNAKTLIETRMQQDANDEFLKNSLQ
jgi:hypothetical protein